MQKLPEMLIQFRGMIHQPIYDKHLCAEQEEDLMHAEVPPDLILKTLKVS
jgi:hypothetical protein